VLCIRRIVIHSHFPEASAKLFRNPGAHLELITSGRTELRRPDLCAVGAPRPHVRARAAQRASDAVRAQPASR
jgi:hypothetical protein